MEKVEVLELKFKKLMSWLQKQRSSESFSG